MSRAPRTINLRRLGAISPRLSRRLLAIAARPARDLLQLSVMKKTRRCPHCGNINPKFLQDNGEAPSSPDLTLLCVRPVAPTDWSFVEAPLPEDFDEDGRVPCGMQWDVNAGAA